MALASKEISAELDHQQTRAGIVSLLRGFFACPAIVALAESGLAERMLEGPFTAADFIAITDTDIMRALFRYLQSLDLLEVADQPEEFRLTRQGELTLRRRGAFLILSSYREYFNSLSSLLAGRPATPSVNRRQNVDGSGSLHSRKFFPTAWEMIGSDTPGGLIDIGCGDGQFLEHACRCWPELPVAAVDLSPVAVEATTARLRAIGKRECVGIVDNGAHIDHWAAAVPSSITSGKSLIVTMWFVIHEFSQGDPDTVCQFFHCLHRTLPFAQVILGEIIDIPPSLLAACHESSIMPEMLFFHALSGQGVLSWDAWKQILCKIPYQLAGERLFDNVAVVKSRLTPSSFVWHLKPTPPYVTA